MLVTIVVLALMLGLVALMFGRRRMATRLALGAVLLAMVGSLGWGQISRLLLPAGQGNGGLASGGGGGLQVSAGQHGGWRISLDAVGGATSYLVFVNGQRVAVFDSAGTHLVREPVWKSGEYAPQPVRIFTAEARSATRVLARWSESVCAPVVLLAARGTNENPPASKFGDGLGSRGWRTWQYLARDLSVQGERTGEPPTVVMASPVRYPASAVQSGVVYTKSRDQGVANLAATWREVRRQCPDSVIVAFGYSQGADVVASVWQRSDTDASAARGVVLFADPHFNRDWVSQGIVQPNGAVYLHNGLLGPRPLFSRDRLDGLQAWCWPADPVCQENLNWHWHGPAYDCYEEHAAADLATRLVDGLRERGYEIPDPPAATCQLDLRGRDKL